MIDSAPIGIDKDFLLAIKASIVAGEAILEVYNASDTIEIKTKSDDSPLTEADRVSNDIINSFLRQTPHPIISEENQQIDYRERKNWSKCWIVDPLDGTKEFIKKNGEFTVNIALCDGGSPIFGVIYVPVSKELYYGDVRKGKSYKTIVISPSEKGIDLFKKDDEIHPGIKRNDRIRVVGSRSHMNPDTEAFIKVMKKEFADVVIVSKGSSLKFCLVAEGQADIYPRFAPTMEWDTAAGSAIVEAVGLTVLSQETKLPLTYNKNNLLNPYFVVR